MTAAVVTLAGVVAALVGALVLAGWWVRGALDAVARSGAAELASDRARSIVERDRDDAIAGRVRAEAERDENARYAASLASSLAAARQELTRYASERITSGSDGDLALELDRLLGAPVSPGPASATTGSGHGAPGPSAVLGP